MPFLELEYVTAIEKYHKRLFRRCGNKYSLTCPEKCRVHSAQHILLPESQIHCLRKADVRKHWEKPKVLKRPPSAQPGQHFDNAEKTMHFDPQNIQIPPKSLTEHGERCIIEINMVPVGNSAAPISWFPGNSGRWAARAVRKKLRVFQK